MVEITRRRAIRAILFDKDGTLIDFQRSWGPVLQEASRFAAEGNEALARRLMMAGGMNPDTLITAADTIFAAGNTAEIADIFRAHGSILSREPLIADLDRLFVSAAERGVPVVPLRPLFEELSGAGYRLGLASSDSETAIRRLLVLEGVDDLVDFVAGYDSGHGVKPEPGMALGFSAALGLPTSAIAMVGDNRHDMRMGRAAQCGLCLAVLTGTGTVERLASESDAVLASIAELPVFFSERSI
ncbi:MAG: HAD family hydrolase [Beijerinckiaceae bacterium]|jgi:phosphoglycolate phosphatase|nr:HAD family hydrolase [Beijerinckiaceae bacterium]